MGRDRVSVGVDVARASVRQAGGYVPAKVRHPRSHRAVPERFRDVRVGRRVRRATSDWWRNESARPVQGDSGGRRRRPLRHDVHRDCGPLYARGARQVPRLRRRRLWDRVRLGTAHRRSPHGSCGGLDPRSRGMAVGVLRERAARWLGTLVHHPADAPVGPTSRGDEARSSGRGASVGWSHPRHLGPPDR